MFVGSYSNGKQAVISVNRQWGDEISVSVQLGRREIYSARGQCQQWGDQAQFVFVLDGHGIVHRGNISESWNGQAVMQGAQDGGFSFQAVRQ